MTTEVMPDLGSESPRCLSKTGSGAGGRFGTNGTEDESGPTISPSLIKNGVTVDPYEPSQ